MSAVTILGASAKAHRYSHRAQLKLQQHGYDVIPVARKAGYINGVSCLHSLAEIDQPVDTITLYVNPAILAEHLDEIVRLKPRRVIFNPGTESDEFAKMLADNGIEVVEGCTLVMLNTGQF